MVQVYIYVYIVHMLSTHYNWSHTGQGEMMVIKELMVIENINHWTSYSNIKNMWLYACEVLS